jgi:hypothetical protein
MFDIVHWAASAAGFLVAARRSRVAVGSSSDAGEVSGDHGVLQLSEPSPRLEGLT